MPRASWRLVVSLLLLFSILPMSRATGAVAQSGSATLTIHSRFCPPEYDGTDIFADCHGNPGLLAIEYSLFSAGYSASSLPDVEGNLTFADLVPGEFRVESNLPAAGQRPAIYCSPGDGSEPTYYNAEQNGDSYSFQINLADGDNITCDWYTLPETDLLADTASLIIHNRFCPVGYDGTDEFADCHGNVGISYVDYVISGANSGRSMLASDGNAYFYWLNPGTTNVTFAYTSSDLPGSISCSNLDTGEQPFLVESVANDEPLAIDLSAGQSVVCDWYIYPPDSYYRATGDFPVFVAQCPDDPGGFAPGELPAQCSPVEGVRVIAYPTAGGMDYASDCVTEANGGCDLQAPGPMPLTVEVDTSTLPAGYLPITNPVNTIAYTEFAGARFILIPAAVNKGD